MSDDARPPTDGPIPAAGPEAMRAAMASYIRAIHQAYLETVSGRITTDGLEALPLAGTPFTVFAVGAGQLHVIATRDQTLEPDPREVWVEESLGPLAWSVRFLDPVVLPALGLVDDTGPSGGRTILEALGVQTVVYQLTSSLEGALSPHQASHAGAGLANAHLRASGQAGARNSAGTDGGGSEDA